MALSGQMINGQAISVQPSQAEKNRAAAAAKMAKAAGQQLSMPQEGPNKIFVAGLKEELSKIGARELRQLFSPFGEIEHVEVNRGVGYIQYRKSRDAREAVTKMDGAEIKGRKIKVGMADTKASIREAQRMGDHEEDGTYLRSQGQKTQLIQKLARDTDLNVSLPPGVASNVPTQYLMISNLWRPKEVDLITNPDFFNDIHDNIMEESRKHGHVDRIFIEKNSENGCAWVKFADISSAQRGKDAMHLRYFGGHQVKVVFVSETMMRAHTI